MHTHTQPHDFSKPCVTIFFCLHIDELSQGLLFCDDGHHIKSSRKAWICSNAAWGRGRHTDTPLPEILDDVWGVRYHLCTGATVDIWWYLEFGMSLSDFFFVRESWQNLPGFDQSLIFLPATWTPVDLCKKRRCRRYDFTDDWSVLGWTFHQKCFALMQKINRIPVDILD